MYLSEVQIIRQLLAFFLCLPQNKRQTGILDIAGVHLIVDHNIVKLVPEASVNVVCFDAGIVSARW
jgi:hypothetical protein